MGAPCSSIFIAAMAAVNFRAYTGTAAGPQMAQRADMVLVRVGDEDRLDPDSRSGPARSRRA
jgi:hypothetical protein